jgi:hypothetical protein
MRGQHTLRGWQILWEREGARMSDSITYKDSYVMYKNWSNGIQKLTDEQAGKLIKSICAFQNGEDTEPDDIAASALFEIFKIKMIEDADAYKAKVEKLKDNFNSQKDNKKSQKGNEKDQMGVVATDTDTVTDTKDNKKNYGEYNHVLLSDKDFEGLRKKHSDQEIQDAVAYLDAYIEDKKYKSKNHKCAMERWVFDAVAEKSKKNDRASPNKTHFELERKYDFEELEKKLIRS